jgi:hypothetical protein
MAETVKKNNENKEEYNWDDDFYKHLLFQTQFDENESIWQNIAANQHWQKRLKTSSWLQYYFLHEWMLHSYNEYPSLTSE